MTVSNTPTSLLDSVLTAQTTRQEIGIAVLKKAQDTQKEEGAALIQMLEEAGSQSTSQPMPLLDVYA